MEHQIQVFAAINLSIVGISHIVRPKAWCVFFIALANHKEGGVFASALISLVFGSLVVGFHQVWTGIPLLLTVVGWAQVLKALVYLVYPEVGLRKLEAVTLDRSYLFLYPGAGFVILAALLAYHLWLN